MRAALAALVTLLLAAPASAHVSSSEPWPGGTIPYFNASASNAASVREAAEAWSSSGARVRFVAVARRRARVIITSGPGRCRGFAAQVGHDPVVRLSRVVLSARGCAPILGGRRTTAAVAAHELGHVLGLRHDDRRCAVMNTGVWESCPVPRRAWRTRCRLVERDDQAGALRLYGGRRRPLGPPTCDRFPALPAPTGLRARSGSRGVVVRWLNVRRTALRGVVVVIGRSCPKRVELVRRVGRSIRAAPGGRGATVVRPSSERFCVALSSVDLLGRVGPVRTLSG